MHFTSRTSRLAVLYFPPVQTSRTLLLASLDWLHFSSHHFRLDALYFSNVQTSCALTSRTSRLAALYFLPVQIRRTLLLASLDWLHFRSHHSRPDALYFSSVQNSCTLTSRTSRLSGTLTSRQSRLVAL